MLNALFDSSVIPVAEQTVYFAQARHNVLAGNIANFNTPGYRTRDLSTDDFQAQLKQAIEIRDNTGQSLNTTVSGQSRENAIKHVEDVSKNILYHDDSDVNLEKQIAEISKNQALHNAALTILTNQFRLLQTAISERVT